MKVAERPFRSEGRARRIAPFVAVTLCAFALVLLPPAESSPVALVGSAVLGAVVLAAALFAPFHRVPGWADAVVPIAYLGMVGLLRHAEGGAASGYGILLLLPVVWLALYGSRRQLALVVAAGIPVYIVPILAFGAPGYPPAEWRRVLLWVLVAGLTGYTVNRLVTEVRSLAARLAHQARTDSLTGLVNRRGLDEALPSELERARRSAQPLVLAMLDLDRFKAFNDSTGHHSGDLLLTEAAVSWRARLRAVDLLARYGGEEFVAVMPACNTQDALATLERVLRATPRGQTCSAGLAEWDGAETPEQLLARADGALYQAKIAGRDRVTAA